MTTLESISYIKIKINLLFICLSAHYLKCDSIPTGDNTPLNQTTLSLESSHSFSHAGQPYLMDGEAKAILTLSKAVNETWRG